MGVKIREKFGKLYLDIYHGGKRKWESLNLTITKDKAQNKEVYRLAEICRSKRETQLLTGEWGINDPVASKIRLITFLEKHAKDYSSPVTMKSFIYHVKKYNSGDTVLVSQITPKWVGDFQEYLEKKSGLAQISAAHYSKILRASLKKAVKENIIMRNPCETVNPIKEPETDLIYLNMNELQKLANTKLDDYKDNEIRRAFLFACHTGLRVCDLETITWGDIETNPMQIIKRQVKTKTHVYIPLSGTAKKLINDKRIHKPDERVFNLPHDHRRQSYHIINRWVKAAGITKKIGWHTTRRTFATLALENKVDIYTLSKLLGQTSIKHTVKYAKVTDRLRREAAEALPEIKLDK
jgi:integrase